MALSLHCKGSWTPIMCQKYVSLLRILSCKPFPQVRHLHQVSFFSQKMSESLLCRVKYLSPEVLSYFLEKWAVWREKPYSQNIILLMSFVIKWNLRDECILTPHCTWMGFITSEKVTHSHNLFLPLHIPYKASNSLLQGWIIPFDLPFIPVECQKETGLY